MAGSGSYIARQVTIECPRCGFYLWKKILITTDVGTGKSFETDEGPICPGPEIGCQAAEWLDFIRHVIKFEPLNIKNPKVKLPPGIRAR